MTENPSHSPKTGPCPSLYKLQTMEPQEIYSKISLNFNKRKVLQNMFLDKEIKSVMTCDLEEKRKSLDVKGKKFSHCPQYRKAGKNQQIWQNFLVSGILY